MKLTGQRNQCAGCKKYFNSNGAFDKHRVGKYGVNRRCLADEEMIAKGMSINRDGFWIAESMPDGLFKKDKEDVREEHKDSS